MSRRHRRRRSKSSLDPWIFLLFAPLKLALALGVFMVGLTMDVGGKLLAGRRREKAQGELPPPTES